MGKFRKEVFVTYFVIFSVIIFALAGLYFLSDKLTGYVIYSQSNQSEFNQGVYFNTQYNGSAVVLSGANLTGTYTSKVFDAGFDAGWNNLTKISSMPVKESFFCVDGAGDVYKSIDGGINWIQTVDNYGRTTVTSDMVSNNYLYILAGSSYELWHSSNGDSFSIINDSFTNKALLVGDVDSNNYLYIATGPGEVWKSENNGVNWEYLSDFNSGATNDPKGFAINSNNVFFAVDGAGDVYSSTDGIVWVKVNDGYGGSTGTDGLEVDSNEHLYILNNYDFYKSEDFGITWNIINNSISPYANVLAEIFINENDEFFILDAIGRVFKSTNFGISWIGIGDCNNGATNNPMGFTNLLQNTNLTFQVRSCDDSICSGESWVSVSNLLSLGVSNNRYFQYKVSFSSPDTSTTPSLSSMNIDYTILNTAPTISIVSPQDGTTYGYNNSLELNFVVLDDNLGSCWYNLDNGANVSIANCQNTTFDISEGSHILTIFANDTYNSRAEDSVSFNIQVGAPTISLTSPINTYLNSGDVVFKYTPTDIDLQACELWGDFDSEFKLNQTDSSPVNNLENIFNLNLDDGTYLWNIRCNDSAGNSAFNGNKTFYVDTISPEVVLTEPSGTKTSRNSIPLNFDITDNSPSTCWYNVYRGDNIEISNTSVNCSHNTNFAVTVDANFILNFYVNDSAGNSNSTNSNFAVSTSGGTTVVVNPGGGGGGGSSNTIIENPLNNFEIEFENILGLILDAGELKKSSVNIKNSGLNYLNECRLKGKGAYSSWISSNEVKGLASGESSEFVFEISIPESSTSGVYNVDLALECKEFSKSNLFNVEIIDKKLGFELIKVTRESNEQIRISYLLEELSSVNQDVEIQFLLVGSNGERVAEIVETKSILANSKQNFETVISIDSSLEGNFNLLVNLNSEVYSTFVQEDVVLTSAVSGFAIFGNEKISDNILSAIILVIFLVFAFFMVSRIMKFRKKHKRKK